MAVIRSISHPMELTFHRAFDVCSTPLFQAIEEVISLGCDRLLTSGRAPTAIDSSGTQCLYDIMTYLHRKSQHHDHSDDQNNSSIYSPSHFSRIQIVAASGIKVTNVRELILSTGVHGVHAGSAVISPASHSLECNLIDPSFEGEGRGCVDEDLVADFVEESEESWDEIERNSIGSSL
jgi:copper homeostasis protein CutC